MKQEQLIKDMMENYPEASRGSNIKCIGWDYKHMEFDFVDEDEDKKYKINMTSLKRGLKKFLKIVQEGKYFNCGVSPNLLSEGYDWDAQDCDALVQCAIFGEVIYG